MATLSTDTGIPSGNAYVERLSEGPLRLARGPDGLHYVTVDLANQANAEASAVRDYYGRYLFELLQNADDAITATGEERKRGWARAGPYRVRIELTDSALIVANDGVPFLEEDVNSIYRWGESSKDRSKSIGYKGIGFKSVLEITDSPEIFSRVVQFRFDHDTCYQRVRAIVGAASDLKLPITRFVFPYTVEEVQPLPDRELVRSLLYQEGFATVIRLPLKAGIGSAQVESRLASDVAPSLLLFLNGIDEIEVWNKGKRRRVLRRKVRTTGDTYRGRDITLYEGRHIDSRWLLFSCLRPATKARAAIDELGDKTWGRVRQVSLAAAFPLDERGRLITEASGSKKLFVYFPTMVETGLRYRVHGDFYIDAARKQVEDRSYNRWLAQQIASFISKDVVSELVQRFPSDERVVRILVPCAEATDFAAVLQNIIREELAHCAFVPSLDGKPRRPRQIVLSPNGATADIAGFHRFFPPLELSNLRDRRQFPLPSVECDAASSAFLAQLGAERLAFEDAFRLFDSGKIAVSPEGYQDLYRFLWHWRESVELAERDHFSEALERARCVITDRGRWTRPDERMYHAKLRQETPSMPRALPASLVHPTAYDPEGRAGPTHRLLSTLRPPIRDYDAPDIIANAIVPLFRANRFPNLDLEERTEVYRYLFDYWRQARRGEGDPVVERVKEMVQVPARPITNRRQDEWRSVSQVYLSSVWSADDRLEQLYDGSEGVVFLYEVRGLDIPPAEREEWAQFWKWLGVAAAPRMLVEEVPEAKLHRGRWRDIQSNHPHAGAGRWLDYLGQLEKQYSRCSNHGSGYRQLRRSVALEGFAELIERRDARRLAILFTLLAENWEHYKRKGAPSAEVQCYRRDCRGQARAQVVPSFFEYLLREADWIPARTDLDGNGRYELYEASHCWFVSPAESPVIRSLLPTPPADYSRFEYRRFCHDIGMRFVEDAKIGDLVDLLRHLPEQYPDPNIVVSSGRRSTPRALATLSRWVIERINNLLVPLGVNERPPQESIPLVASEGGALRYVQPPEPVFFADDRFHAARWREHLPFASLDKNWGDAARYLGIQPISECVKESHEPGEVLKTESARLDRYLKVARPYLLAVVHDQQESETEDVARYLSNLDIRVVDSLVVHRRLAVPPGKVLVDSEARIYLEEKTGPRAGSAGRAPRSGVLYVRRGYEEDYDLLAGAIAEFIRIPGLTDAFVILLDRGGLSGRKRYLQTRGLDESHVAAMRELLSRLGVTAEAPESPYLFSVGLEFITELDGLQLSAELRQHFEEIGKGLASQSLVEVDQTGSSWIIVDVGTKYFIQNENGTLNVYESPPLTRPWFKWPPREPGPTPSLPPKAPPPPAPAPPEPIELAPLDLSDVQVTYVKAAEGALRAEPEGRRSGGGGGPGRDWERDQRLRDIYGKRGEQVVQRLELDRLRERLERPEEVVRWLREEGYEAADHDFESKDLVEGEWVDIVIEVKATPGFDFRVHMSREELDCAQRWGNRYRLYRVIDVASATPQVFVFGNPYILWQQGRAVIEPRDTYVTLPDPRKRPGEQGTGEQQ